MDLIGYMEIEFFLTFSLESVFLKNVTGRLPAVVYRHMGMG